MLLKATTQIGLVLIMTLRHCVSVSQVS